MTPETHDEANASTLREIQRVVTRCESPQAEFKRTTGQRTDAAKTICGMLNASGGFVIFGVTDDGRILGQQVTAGTLADVARELGRIDPQALLSPEAVDLEDGTALVLVRVPKGDGPYTYDGRPYLRVGPTTVLRATVGDGSHHGILRKRARGGDGLRSTCRCARSSDAPLAPRTARGDLWARTPATETSMPDRFREPS